MADNDRTETRSLGEVITDAIRAKLLETYVAFPGRVEAYDEAKQKADIQPLRKKKYKNNTTETTLPIIPSVPVINIGGTDSYLYIPVKVGDTGLLVWCDRSIDTWKVSGGLVSPNDPRAHNPSDAIFIPGLRSFAGAISVTAGNAKLKNNSMSVELFPSGKIKIQGGTNELISILSDWMGHVINGQILTGIGPQGWITTTKTLLQTDKSKLDSLKA